jgi:oligosaccharide repeat unit polymerase
MKLFSVLIFVLTVFRAFAWSERLALFEVLLVIAIFWAGYSDRASRGWIGRIRPILPVIAVAIVVVVFGVAEYFRSWSSFYAKTESDYWAFIGQRLINYYAQALNTGAGLVTMLDWPSYQFGYLLEWLAKFPVLLGPIMRYLTDLQPNFFLERFGDPEFNNPSGIFSVLYDVGLGPAIAIFALTGLLAQSAYRAFQDRDNIFSLFYPVFFMALVEMFRYWYLGNSRTFLFVIALGLGVMLAQPIRKPQASGLGTAGYA